MLEMFSFLLILMLYEPCNENMKKHAFCIFAGNKLGGDLGKVVEKNLP